MTELSDPSGQKKESAHDHDPLNHGLSVGVHHMDKELDCYKYFRKCRLVQTWAEWGRGEYKEASLCWARVRTKGRVVRPQLPNEPPSDDLRTNTLYVGDIVTPCGQKCVSAKSPIYEMPYEPNKTFQSELNTETDVIEAKGLHCFTSMDSLKKFIGFDHRPQITITTYNKHGNIIKVEQQNNS